MICPNCGSEKIENANFCFNCGYQFSNDGIEEVKDNYLINVNLSIALGLCVGIITGLFSAAIHETIVMPWWGWWIVLVVITIFLVKLLFTSFADVEKSLKRQMRRKKN
jgi:uncharacterized membrane protein YvbJ